MATTSNSQGHGHLHLEKQLWDLEQHWATYKVHASLSSKRHRRSRSAADTSAVTACLLDLLNGSPRRLVCSLQDGDDGGGRREEASSVCSAEGSVGGAYSCSCSCSCAAALCCECPSSGSSCSAASLGVGEGAARGVMEKMRAKEGRRTFSVGWLAAAAVVAAAAGIVAFLELGMEAAVEFVVPT